jgi:hypothetical protein
MQTAAIDLNLATIGMVVDDRSLGEAGSTVRQSVQGAFVPAATVQERHDEILQLLAEGLDDAHERAISVNANTFVNAANVMMAIPAELPLPRVAIESPDEIGLDWDKDVRHVLSLTVDLSDIVGYSALLGLEPHYGSVRIATRLPDTISFLLSRIYSADRTLAGRGR